MAHNNPGRKYPMYSEVTIDKVFDDQCNDNCVHKCILKNKISNEITVQYLTGHQIYIINSKNIHNSPEHIKKQFTRVNKK